MEFKRTARRTPRPDMMPMIDVVFFLLVFFMLFSTLRAAPMGLDVELPSAASGTPQQASPFEISVNREGAFYVADRMVTGTELRSQLQSAMASNPDVFVIIKADRQVRYEHVVSAIDHVRQVGGSRLGLAVEQRDS